jgi:hypothetical protein
MNERVGVNLPNRNYGLVTIAKGDNDAAGVM